MNTQMSRTSPFRRTAGRGVAVAAAAAAFAVAFTGSSASAAELAGTPDGKHWYIGSGNAYGEVRWDDYAANGDDMDVLTLDDDIFPSGYSVKMTVKQGSFKKTVSAKNGEFTHVRIPGFTKGEKASFTACAWDNGDKVMCRAKTTVTE